MTKTNIDSKNTEWSTVFFSTFTSSFPVNQFKIIVGFRKLWNHQFIQLSERFQSILTYWRLRSGTFDINLCQMDESICCLKGCQVNSVSVVFTEIPVFIQTMQTLIKLKFWAWLILVFIDGRGHLSHLMRLWHFSYQTCMRSHPVGLDIWFLVSPFAYFHTSCVRTVKALASLRGCDKYHNHMSWLIFIQWVNTNARISGPNFFLLFIE